jgi:hypothetical protein
MVMKSTVFWDATLPSSVKVARCLLAPLLFDTEDVGLYSSETSVDFIRIHNVKSQTIMPFIVIPKILSNLIEIRFLFSEIKHIDR